MSSIANQPESLPIPARLIDAALGLARAEIALALVHARQIAVRAVSAVLATIVAAAFAQLAILLLVLSPLLAKVLPIGNLVVAIVLPLVLALVGAFAAFLSWRTVHQSVRSRSISEPADLESPRLASVVSEAQT